MNAPWELEPDELDWVAWGYKCALRRGPVGHWCGYVGIPEGHPMHGIEYSQRSEVLVDALARRLEQPIGETPAFSVMMGILGAEIGPTPETAFQVHGGLTYARDYCPRSEPDGNWWFGFDCAHAGDWCPQMIQHPGDVYRDMEFAQKETERLAAQLAAIESPMEEAKNG